MIEEGTADDLLAEGRELDVPSARADSVAMLPKDEQVSMPDPDDANPGNAWCKTISETHAASDPSATAPKASSRGRSRNGDGPPEWVVVSFTYASARCAGSLRFCGL